jgi:uncharacterized glyoxalase superfamily protein PhnB
MGADFQSVMPLIPTGGTLAEALDFFMQQLGFEVTRQWESGAVIRRGDVSFMLVPNNNREWADSASFSIGVSDLEALYEEYKSRSVPMGRLEMKFWGAREFHMIVPSGVCLQFFQQG